MQSVKEKERGLNINVETKAVLNHFMDPSITNILVDDVTLITDSTHDLILSHQRWKSKLSPKIIKTSFELHSLINDAQGDFHKFLGICTLVAFLDDKCITALKKRAVEGDKIP